MDTDREEAKTIILMVLGACLPFLLMGAGFGIHSYLTMRMCLGSGASFVECQKATGR